MNEQPPFPESWEARALRLARELKATAPTDEAPSAKQRLRHRAARYAMYLHLEAVPE